MSQKTEEKKEQTIHDLTPPEEFFKIINDFTTDMMITFPEYTGIIQKWWVTEDSSNEEKEKKNLFIFRHCIKTFPERFFDILYQNNDIFKEESEVNTEFLPGIVFKQLWTCDISEKTRETIWKYLQLILFAVIGTVNTRSQLGDTAKLFEAINEDELKTKLQETIESMQTIFDLSGNMESFPDIEPDMSGASMNIPNAEEIHNHIHGMMEGKLGKLAMELAEETAKDLNLDMENVTDANGVFQKLFKNPGKLMNMIKNVGDKIDTKIKSGELKESELITEGMEMLNKMKNMPGMGNMQEMFSKLGIPGLGKGGKMNMGAMEAQMNKNLKLAKMKERMRSKVSSENNNTKQTSNHSSSISAESSLTEEQIISIFSTGETVEKTPRGAKPPTSTNKKNKNKSKK